MSCDCEGDTMDIAYSQQHSFTKMLRASKPLASGCTRPVLVKRITHALSRRSDAIAKLNLLRLTKIICEIDDHRDGAMGFSDLAQIVEYLSNQDEAVLVREVSGGLPALR